MAQTVNSAFNNFNTDEVNLIPDRTKKGRSSRDWLYGQLNNLDSKEDLHFPFKYSDMHIKFGSFSRNTKIRELDDIDLMFCLNADGATYNAYNNNEFSIITSNAGQRLKNLSDGNILNSRKVVNKLKLSLSLIEHYKSADLHSRGEAATLNLNSYEWVFDIVPCFYTDTGLYLIPDGNGNWKGTDPRIDQTRVTTINQKHDGRVLQLIRTLKYWNRRHSSHTIPSYLLESMILSYADSKEELSEWIDINVKNFFNYLTSAILSSVDDPKGLQGDLNSFSYQEKFSISQKADWAYKKAKEAIFAEVNEKDQEKSINKWRELFGTDFPNYG